MLCVVGQFYDQECGVFLILLLKYSGQQELESLNNINAKCKSDLLHADVDQHYLFKYW